MISVWAREIFRHLSGKWRWHDTTWIPRNQRLSNGRGHKFILSMVLILDGNSEIVENVRSNICNMNCERCLIRSRAVTDRVKFSYFPSCVRNIFRVTMILFWATFVHFIFFYFGHDYFFLKKLSCPHACILLFECKTRYEWKAQL